MKKPTSVLKREFTAKLVDVINNSGLPYLVVEPIIKDVWNEIKTKEEETYQREKATYEQAMLEEAQNNKEPIAPLCPPKFVEGIYENIRKEQENLNN